MPGLTSILDEVDDSIPPTAENMPGLTTLDAEQETSPRPSAEESDEEKHRLAAERKRKGKQAAPSLINKSSRPSKGKSIEASLPPPAKVSYASEADSPTQSEESEEVPEEILNFEPAEVWITKSLLDAMRKFDDPKQAATYKEQSGPGKLAKSGKRYDPKELKEISSDEEFQQFIDAIGFDWLLKHSSAEVPMALAREFFSTFRLKSTTDLDADSITFRLFAEEHKMSIREWSLRMGLFTRTEDDEGLWNERVVGAPRFTPGFTSQIA